MGISVRPRLVAGFTVIVVGAIAIPPPAPVPAAAEVRTAAQVGAGVQVSAGARVTPRIELAANVADTVRNIVSNPPNPAHFAAAGEALSRITSSSAPQPAAGTPRAAALPPAPPVTFNAASDGIVAAYQAIQYWVDYGVQLSSYVLQFVPFGYQISSQINIFYYNLIRPIANSVVYDLIVPVVNDPLNPASYVNGLITVGQASVTAAINTGIAEFNQFFGWLIPPLPPRPLVSTAAVAKASAPEAATATSAEPVTDPPVDVAPEETPTELPEPAAPDVGSAETSEPVDQTPAKATPEVTTPKVDADTAVPTAPVAESVPAAAGTEKTPLQARGSATSTSTADGADDSPEAAEHPAKKTTADKPRKADEPAKADGSKKAKDGKAKDDDKANDDKATDDKATD